MKKITSKITTKFELSPLIKGARGIFALAIFLFGVSFVRAELNVLWFTNTLDVEVGKTFKIDLYIEPNEDHPVITVSNALNYNPQKVKFKNAKFPENWTVLSESPESVTDEANGYLRRTGGVANGVNKNIKYVTYEFEALSAGTAEFYIEDGYALDMENNNIGFENKKMRINIFSKAETAENENASTTKIIEERKEIILPPPSLDISGKNAIFQGEDYEFKISLDPNSTNYNLNMVKMTLFNSEGQEIYTAIDSFRGNSKRDLKFNIPAEFTREGGDFKVVLKTNYLNKKLGSNSYKEVISEKEFGVLSNNKSFLDNYRLEFFLIFGLVVLIAFLYHIHNDHIIFRKLKARLGEYHEIKVDHKK